MSLQLGTQAAVGNQRLDKAVEEPAIADVVPGQSTKNSERSKQDEGDVIDRDGSSEEPPGREGIADKLITEKDNSPSLWCPNNGLAHSGLTDFGHFQCNLCQQNLRKAGASAPNPKRNPNNFGHGSDASSDTETDTDSNSDTDSAGDEELAPGTGELYVLARCVIIGLNSSLYLYRGPN
jgi:hypothetical protein